MKKLIISFSIITISLSLSAQNNLPKTALLLIDIQEFYFPGGFSELKNPDEASINANKLLNKFREKDWFVVHITHKVDNQGEINPKVKPLEGEKVIIKEQINSFYQTDLKELLDANDITHIVICGMMTHMCVEAATRAAHDLGFKVTVIGDACATKDLNFGDKIINAVDVHNSTLATLQAYAIVMNAEEYVNSIP